MIQKEQVLCLKSLFCTAFIVAPVFAVHFDNEELDTRIEFKEEGRKLTFDDGDLLPLYHGVSTDGNDNYASFINYQNAIYRGESDGGAFTFKTVSMVNPGGAVMVWPAEEATGA